MKIFDVLVQDEKKVIAWIKAKEPAFVTAIQQAAIFTQNALAYAKQPSGVAVEAYIEANLPASAKVIAGATEIATALLQDMLAVKSVASLEGIALRLGAEVLQVIDGKKLPSGIDGYIAEFQKIFIG